MVWARGTQINGYTIDSVLGKGGFGITYKALKRFGNTDQWVVLKTINDERRADPEYPTFVELFKKEVTVMAELMPLKHPHMASVYDYCDTDNLLYCVIQFINGENLKKRVERKGALPELEALLYIQHIGKALDALHKHGKIHRDAHPQNIMISDGQAWLIDFGLVCSIEPTGSVYIGGGFWGFAPGEQLPREGQRNNLYQAYNRQPTVDIYTLASSLYYALTAENPDPDRNFRHPAISDQVNNAIIQARQPDPRNRPQSIPAWFRLLGVDKSQSSRSDLKNEVLSRFDKVNDLDDTTIAKPFSIVPRLLILGILFVIGLVGGTFAFVSVLRDEPPEGLTGQGGTGTPTNPETPPLTPTFLGFPVQSFSYTSARVSAAGDISPYDATGQRYTETALNLPAGAVPLEMVAIEGGTFTMGSPDTEADRDSDEGPQHQVTVPDFFMGQYEVTQAQYAAVMGNNPANFKGDNNPVQNVSWDDAQTFIQRLNRLTGKTYRLPTEAEWEYAARAGTSTPFSYGDNITPKVVNYSGNNPYTEQIQDREYKGKTIAVDTLYPNPWGLYHIHGNVWEWVEDGWHDNYNGAPTDGTAWLYSDERRGLRGGSWIVHARLTRSALRGRGNRGVRDNDLGFRVVLVP